MGYWVSDSSTGSHLFQGSLATSDIAILKIYKTCRVIRDHVCTGEATFDVGE